jgi:type II secretory pathway component PulC
LIGGAFWTLLLGGCASTGGPSDPASPPPGDSSRLLATEEAEARRTESVEALPVTPAPAAPVPSGVCAEVVRPGVLRRAAVARVVDRGLGQWLSHVEVRALRSGRKFTGWQVLQLYPDDPCYRVVDIQRGDVVTKVNGTSLEKPDQANQVFQGLRTAPGLEIDLLRQGVARRVSLTIVD